MKLNKINSSAFFQIFSNFWNSRMSTSFLTHSYDSNPINKLQANSSEPLNYEWNLYLQLTAVTVEFSGLIFLLICIYGMYQSIEITHPGDLAFKKIICCKLFL